MTIGDDVYKFQRCLAVAGAVAIFFSAGAFIVLPSRTVAMATGAEDGANYKLGMPLGRLTHSFTDDAIALWNANLEEG